MPASAKPASSLFDRRTITVLGSLVLSMSAVSALLLVLEPRPLAPIGGPVLTVLEPSSSNIDTLFGTNPPVADNRWQAIVVHHSGTTRGNAQTLAEIHQSQGYPGLGFHFVIGNGEGAGDGEVQIGYRWKQQTDGFYRDAISVCLIGDGDRSAPTAEQMDQLIRLVTVLQQKLNLPAERVLLHTTISQETTSPGRLFPASAFRQQLLANAQ